MQTSSLYSRSIQQMYKTPFISQPGKSRLFYMVSCIFLWHTVSGEFENSHQIWSQQSYELIILLRRANKNAGNSMTIVQFLIIYIN